VVAEPLENELGVECFDGVVSIWCHMPPKLRESLHHRVVASLKLGGVVLLEAYHPRQLGFKTGGPPVAELMMRASDLKSDFKGLHMVLLEECERQVIEGVGHTGLSAVTQMIARKE